MSEVFPAHFCGLAGDEFTIILEGVRSPAQCARIGAKVVDAMRPLFTVGELASAVSTSIGIAWTDSALPDARALSKEADAALYQAKTAGRNQCCVGTAVEAREAPTTAGPLGNAA